MLIKVNLKDPKEEIEIDLEIIEASERLMGVERIWGGTGYDSNGEEIELEIAEYPEGAYNSIVKKDKRIIESDEELGSVFVQLLHTSDMYDEFDFSEEIKSRIISIVKSDSSNKPNLQKIMKAIMDEYDYSGIGAYSEIADLLRVNILKINNSELDDTSVISLIN